MCRYAACESFVQARFCTADYKGYGFTSMKVRKITHVYNRMLQGIFDNILRREVNDADEVEVR